MAAATIRPMNSRFRKPQYIVKVGTYYLCESFRGGQLLSSNIHRAWRFDSIEQAKAESGWSFAPDDFEIIHVGDDQGA